LSRASPDEERAVGERGGPSPPRAWRIAYATARRRRFRGSPAPAAVGRGQARACGGKPTRASGVVRPCFVQSGEQPPMVLMFRHPRADLAPVHDLATVSLRTTCTRRAARRYQSADRPGTSARRVRRSFLFRRIAARSAGVRVTPGTGLSPRLPGASWMDGRRRPYDRGRPGVVRSSPAVSFGRVVRRGRRSTSALQHRKKRDARTVASAASAYGSAADAVAPWRLCAVIRLIDAGIVCL